MSYTEDILYLRKKVPNYNNESTKWLFNKIRKQDKDFIQIGLDKLYLGKFYFMQYDLKKLNKSTKLEQFVPMMVVDYKPAIDTKVMWVLNMNFMPNNIKEAFFSSFLDKNQNVLETNLSAKDWTKELPIPNINYKKMWNELIPFGFEYAIREIRVDLINNLWGVSSKDVVYLTTLNTQVITGVDDNKLNEIWITKLKNENLEDRVNELKNIKTNYENILKDLANKFKSLNKNLKGI